MFDFFYQGTAQRCYPGHGQPAASIADAVQRCRTRFFWFVTGAADLTAWDLSWEPPPWQSHFRHAWPSQWQADSGVYLVPRRPGPDTMYHDAPQIPRLADPASWSIPAGIDSDDFDFSWHPDHREPSYEYHFGTQWQITGGPVYRGDQGIKYIDSPRAKALPNVAAWQIPPGIDQHSWNFSWHPDLRDPPFVYDFGTTWHDRGGPRFMVPGATQTKHMSWPRACYQPSTEHWHDVTDLVYVIDQTWRPHPNDPPFIYVFGNQWYPAEIMPTAEYRVPGATVRKYMEYPRAQLAQRHDNHWHTLEDCEWDYSWVPDPGDPPYIYVFGNQWWPAEKWPTVEYHVPGAVERKFMSDPRCRLLPDMVPWSVPQDIDASAVDFSWRPDPGSPPYIYHFGSDHQSAVGLTYTVPGATAIKFAGAIPVLDPGTDAVIQPDVFYIDHSNRLSEQRFHALQLRVPGVQRVRFVNGLLDTLRRAAKKAQTSTFWAVSSHNDYRDFDFSWHAQIWQRGMIHVFGTQWNKWSDTFLVDVSEFRRQEKWQSRIEDFYNLNFVSHQAVLASADAADIVVIDHGNAEVDAVVEDLQLRVGRIVRRGRYFNNYRDTLVRLLQDLTGDHAWIVSSLCDYREFDFSWQPEAWQRDMLHVFATGSQKFGDTFFVPVQMLREQLSQTKLLEWINPINFCQDQTVRRWPMPVIQHTHNSHVHARDQVHHGDPLLLFTVNDPDITDIPVVSLWSDSSQTIVPLDAAASTVVVPQRALADINTQFYDYPHIDHSHAQTLAAPLQDVVFISYDEPEADRNWEILSDLCPRAQRLHGVSGIENALEAAADLSATPWFFAVFAKTRLEPSFDFRFVPDYLQQPKHYIFNCRNSVNGLEYGHMGVILHNCAAIREVNRRGEWGLDYTLSWPSESIPVLSCHGDFNTTPYHTWRTAFRETAKLAWFEQQHSTVEGAYRLRVWQTRAQGAHSEWCLRGAQDGFEFFQQCAGDLDQLRQSFRWQWLRSRFVDQYSDID